jgi:hypothetical protein
MKRSGKGNSSYSLRGGAVPLIGFGVVSSLLVCAEAIVALHQVDQGAIGYLPSAMLALGVVWCVLVGWVPRGVNLLIALAFLALDTLLMAVSAYFIDMWGGPHFDDWTVFGLIFVVPAWYGCIAVGLVIVYGVSDAIRRYLTRRRTVVAIAEVAETADR